MEILLVIVWLLGAIIAGFASQQKGCSFFATFIVSILLSPIFGILYVIALPDMHTRNLLIKLSEDVGAMVEVEEVVEAGASTDE